MSLLARYRESLAQIASQALRDLVAQHPHTSVADLRELVASDPSLGSLTLSQLLGRGDAKAKTSAIPKRSAPARPGKAPAAAKPSVPRQTQLPFAPTSKKTREQWNTLTAEGRAALDHAVLESLTALGQSVSAEALRARLGATPAQLRSSLNRHIEAGAVSYSGQARGTRYSLEG